MAVRPYDIWTEYKGNADDGYGLIFDIPSNFGIRVHFCRPTARAHVLRLPITRLTSEWVGSPEETTVWLESPPWFAYSLYDLYGAMWIQQLRAILLYCRHFTSLFPWALRCTSQMTDCRSIVMCASLGVSLDVVGTMALHEHWRILHIILSRYAWNELDIITADEWKLLTNRYIAI